MVVDGSFEGLLRVFTCKKKYAVGEIIGIPMTIGLTGQLATSSVNADGLILKYYGKLDPKTSSGYTTKTPKTSVSGYSSKTPKNTTGYVTKTPA